MMYSRYVFLLIVCGSVCLQACTRAATSPPAPSVAARPDTVYRNLSAEATYVGIDACKTCHAAKYETYSQAQMGRSFRPATLTNSDADFDAPDPVYDPERDLYYQPFHRGEDLFIEEYRLAGADTVHRRVEQIDYIVGSGHHTNSHIMEVNGYLYQMPVTWYAQEATWDLAPKFDDGNNYRFSRPITQTCMTCHNAMPDYVEGSDNRFTRVPHGIDCERCHGPGSIHVREKRAGRMVDVTKEVDYTIVNPRKLSLDRQFDICRRCHMQGASVFRPGKRPQDFRPGMRLEEVENVFWTRFTDSTSRFIMASHPDRLKMSACFQGSHAAEAAYEPMTCTTCHDPHVSIEALGTDAYSDACRTCHTREQQNLCTAEAVVNGTATESCASCHMPRSGVDDIPHVRVTDHFIRIPGTKRAGGRAEDGTPPTFVRLAGLIDPDPTDLDLADGYLTYHEQITNQPGLLDSAAVYLQRARPGLSTELWDQYYVRLLFEQRNYEGLMQHARSMDARAVSDAWTLYRIGEAFSKSGRYQEAVFYFGQAVDRAPEHLRFMDKLASAYGDAGQLDRAVALYSAIIEANPLYGAAYNNRGFTRLVRGDFVGAEADFLQAIGLDPDAEMALANLASLYFNTNRRAQARPYAERLVRLAPDNAGYRRLWDALNEGNEAG